MSSEDEPKLELSVKGEKYFATRENTTLFTFFGNLAMYNHVFLELEELETQVMGAYVFCDHPAYETLGNFVVEHDFPMVLNRNDVPTCDMDAWSNAHLQDLGDFIPDSFFGEGDGNAA